MAEEIYFNNELRRCLDAAGLSDCGENDCWNYWYQRLHKAHDAAVDRVTDVQRAENAKLRELVRVMAYCMQQGRDCDGCAANGADGAATAPSGCDWLRDRMREMGVVE